MTSRDTKAWTAGFTLVELLVVIGIVGVLIGILLPALSKARRNAKRVQDLSNIHQVGLGCLMYANDFKGYWPIGCTSGPTGTADQHDWIYSYTFDYFLSVLVNRQTAADWFSTTAPYPNGKPLELNVQRSLMCTSMWDSETLMPAFVGELGYRYASTPMTYFGFIYWGRRGTNGYSYINDQSGVTVSPLQRYVFPVRQGLTSTSRVLLSCFACSSPANATDLPHCYGNDQFYKGGPTGSAGDGRSDVTSRMAGMNFAYVDGSARWVDRRGLWSAGDGNDWFYYENTGP